MGWKFTGSLGGDHTGPTSNVVFWTLCFVRQTTVVANITFDSSTQEVSFGVRMPASTLDTPPPATPPPKKQNKNTNKQEMQTPTQLGG